MSPYIQAQGKDPEEYVFSPEKAAKLRSTEQRKNRKSKVQPSQQKRHANAPGRKYLSYYTKDAYSNAIDRAIKRAGVSHWSSHQLRHLRATEVYEKGGIYFTPPLPLSEVGKRP